MSFADLRLRIVRFGAALALAAPLAACAGDDGPAPRAEMPETPPEQIYAVALTQLDKGNWPQCAAAFDEVERQHPYSVWARRAILMSAYCHYQGNKYNDAILAADRFITLHPGNKEIAYAYYLTPKGAREKVQTTLGFLRRRLDEYREMEREIEELRREVGTTREGSDGLRRS